MSLVLGTPVKLAKISKKDFLVPVRDKNGGIIGFLRILFVGVEIALSLTGFGAAFNAGVAAIGGLAQAALTTASYLKENIRDTGSFAGALALDIIPGILPGISLGLKAAGTGGIVVSTIDEVEEVAKVERVFIKKTSEYKEFNELFKSRKVKSMITRVESNGKLLKAEKVSSLRMGEYRQRLLKEQIKLGKNTGLITEDAFETAIQNVVKTETILSNRDIAILRSLKSTKNIEGKTGFLFNQLSESALKDIGGGDNLRNLVSDLAQYVDRRKITSKINRIFGGGKSDWSTKEFWETVRNGKFVKSGNFWTQFAQLGNANDFAREIISKPFNALSRKVKETLTVLRNKIAAKKTWIRKIVKYEHELKRELNKSGKWFGGELVLGYRILQEHGKSKSILIHFNRRNTSAKTFGSKNFGGKDPIIIPNIPNHMLKQWNRSSSKGQWYLYHLALSRGGRAIGFAIANELFASFLTFVPMTALRNILSIISNVKSIGKDIKNGVYFQQWTTKFTHTLKRLLPHKIGKVAGSSLYIFGKGAGKEGQRLGLGVAKGFQHNNGQRLGEWKGGSLLWKEVIPKGAAGTLMRERIKRGKKTATQSRQKTKRIGVNLRRTFNIPKF